MSVFCVLCGATVNGKKCPDCKLAKLKSIIRELNGLVDVPNMLETEAGLEETSSCKYYDVSEFNSLEAKLKNGLSFFHLNIASLNAHHDELIGLLRDLKSDFSIIGITETRVCDSHLPENLTISNYNAFQTPREGKCGGSLLYVSKTIDAIHRPDLEKLMYKSKLLETSFVEISREKQKNIVVGCIYRHHGLTIKDFIKSFIIPLLTKVNSENKLVVLMGDFNINLMEYGSDKHISNFLDAIGSFALIPNITLPTRIADDTRTLIDNIFTSPELFGTASGNVLTCISDHLAQFSLLEDLKPFSPKQPVTKRDWAKFNEENFLTQIQNLDWKDLLQSDLQNPNVSMENFLKCIEDLLDQHAPVKQFRPKNVINLKSSPWMTPEILNSMKVRDKLYKSFMRAKDPLVKNTLRDRFKAYRNSIVSICRQRKIDFYQNFFQENIQNSANVWKGINCITAIKRKVQSTVISLEIDGKVTSDPPKVVNKFNTFFATIANKIKKDIPKTPKSYKDFLKNPNPKSIFLSQVSANEVLECLDSLDNGKANGPASIPPKVLNLIKAEISTPLAEIFNLSFNTGIFPDVLKLAKVLPVYKNKGSTTDCSNYRPISLLSNLDKVLEKLIYKRVYGYLTRLNLLYTRQFGFRRKHSTVHTLLNMCQKIADALDNKKFVCGVFVDLQKAFDTVDHAILLAKLQHYGIRGKAYSLFKSYLSGRKQFVSISGCNSSELLMKHGVPQGSVLGPLLFLIYINDLNFAIKGSIVHHFADDTNLLCITDSLESLVETINLDLQSLWHWLSANEISLNASKTEYVLFRHPNRKIDMEMVKLSIGGFNLSESKSIKYLGVQMDSDLKWHTQVNDVAVKLRKANGVLSKLRHYVPESILTSVYYAIFFSQLMYCCQIWGQSVENVSVTLLKRIKTLQNSALKLMSFSNFRAHSSPIYRYFNTLKFSDIVKLQNVLFLHDIYKGAIPSAVVDTFDIDFTHARKTRSSVIGQINSVSQDTTTYGTASWKVQGITSWNKCQYQSPEPLFFDLSRDELKESLTKTFISKY